MKIKDLIKKLKKFDKETEVYISDADTDWPLEIYDIFINKGHLFLEGRYDNPNNPRSENG